MSGLIRGFLQRVSRNVRSIIATLHDLVAAAIAWQLAYLLRFNFEIPPNFLAAMWSYLVWVIPIQGLTFYMFGLYRGIWRFASIPDLRRIALATGTAALAVPAILFMNSRLEVVPRSVLIMDPILLFLIMGGSRFLYRAWKDGHLLSPRQLGAEPVIIMGAGSSAALLLRDLSNDTHWRPVALLDDDRSKVGLRLLNVQVRGTLTDINIVAKRYGATHAIIAMPSSTGKARRRAAELAVNAGLRVLTVPAISDMLTGKVSVSQVRSVELEDLLGRAPVQLDDAGLSIQFAGQVVLVTGAGGSIGSELCRQIARFAPSCLVLFEMSEIALYTIEQEFLAAFPKLPLVCIVGDVKDSALIDHIFTEYKPGMVFHAAAYKHVPLMETENAWQAVRNNILGTLRVAQCAAKHRVREFVLVSTDKAVNPTNVMGATKRMAERVCQAIQATTQESRFVMVRFGNVLGSSGSVIPKFKEQIAQGGPITVTHADITRYFMLIPEAAQLVLQAGLLACSQSEGGRIFVLDMGEPVRIIDLARDMIRLSGYSEDEIKLEITGLRPGEKLYEELLADNEATMPTPHPKLRIAQPEQTPGSVWLASLEHWLSVAYRSEQEVKVELQRQLPEYQPAIVG